MNKIPKLRMTRRDACKSMAALAATACLGRSARAADDGEFELNYILGTCMYGTTALDEILPEVEKIDAEYVDIWPRVHGNQREQIEEMGHDKFGELLEAHNVKLGIVTRYDLGPWKLVDDMDFAGRFGAKLMICGSGGPKGLSGAELKSAVGNFIEKIKPHTDAAAEHGLQIGIENHANALVDSPDSLRYLAEMSDGMPVGIAFAPYHLPQDAALQASLIEEIGPQLFHYYAWEHGVGSHEKRPKEEEMLQMPGYGEFDFAPSVAALRKIQYKGLTEIFMHPVPRGVPILEPTSAVTDAINKSRQYLAKCVEQTA